MTVRPLTVFWLVAFTLCSSEGSVRDPAVPRDPAQLCNSNRLAQVNITWAPVDISQAKAIFFDGHLAYVGDGHKCTSGPEFPHAFQLQDIMTVGHMHRTFATFFSYLCSVPPNGHVAAVWGEAVPTSVKSALSTRELVYEPLLRMYQRYFRRQRNLHLHVIAMNKSSCLRAGELGQRRCTLAPVPPRVMGTTGNCGNWFDSADTVAAWRAMLASEAGLRFPLKNLLRLPRRTPWNVLVYDRPGDRRFLHPDVIRRETLQFLRTNLPGSSVLVQMHTFLEPDFVAQCHLFNRYDLIILGHGAAVSHMVCARPGAMVIEVGWYWYGSFLVLAQQLLVHRCFAAVADHLYVPTAYNHFKDPLHPVNLSSCLRQFVALHTEDLPTRRQLGRDPGH